MDLSTIIQAARDITGNEKTMAAGDQFVPDEAIETDLTPIIRILNNRFGNVSGKKETIFNTIAGQQDYLISTYVGTDVERISKVMREGSFVPDYFLGAGDGVDILNYGGPTNQAPIIPAGFQANTFDVIVQMNRSEVADRFDWEEFQGKIRLYPVPTRDEVIAVQYVSTGSSIDTLPEKTMAALTYAAVVAIIDSGIMRMGHNKALNRAYGEGDANPMDAWLTMRNIYAGKLESEMGSL